MSEYKRICINQVMFYMLCCNQLLAASRAFVFVKIRSSLVHCAGFMVHDKRCSSACRSSQSQVSSSPLKPHFTMLALVLTTPSFSLFKVFHIGHCKYLLNGSCCVV